jgi:TonB family protein
MNSVMIAEPISKNWVGRVIDGRFTLCQWLGGTTRSEVFLTEPLGPNAQKAVVKLIQADAGEAEARIAAWKAQAKLQHPHLIRLFHAGTCEVDGRELLYAVSEYAEEILSEVLPTRALTPEEARQMLDPVVDTLNWLHGTGFVHGHVKPSNILVVDDQLKLSADSLYLAGEYTKHLAEQGIYGAPEMAKGMITPAADVWSLGVTLVEALTQRPPAWDEYGVGEPVVTESTPEPFAGIARACLRSDPADRCTLNVVTAWLQPPQAPKIVAIKVDDAAVVDDPVVEFVDPATNQAAVIDSTIVESENTVEAGTGNVRFENPAAKVDIPVAKAEGPTAERVVKADIPVARTSKKKGQGRFPVAAPVGAALVAAAIIAILYVRSNSSQPSVPDTTTSEQSATQGQGKPSAGSLRTTRPETPVAVPAPPEAQEQTPAGDAAQTAQAPVAAARTPETSGSSGSVVNGSIVSQVMPEILPQAQQSIQGKVNVQIRVTVDAAGNVSGATFESEGTSKYFASAALKAAQHWKFRPAQSGGQAVPSAWILNFHFTQSGNEVTPVAAR